MTKLTQQLIGITWICASAHENFKPLATTLTITALKQKNYVNENTTVKTDSAEMPKTQCGAVNPPIAYTMATLPTSPTQSIVTSLHVNMRLKFLGLTTTKTCAEQLSAALPQKSDYLATFEANCVSALKINFDLPGRVFSEDK
jgi:hypothetical protein